MADRPKLPKSIVVLNIIMAVVLLAICALAVALFVQAKDLGWSLPTPDSSPVSSAASNADAAGRGFPGRRSYHRPGSYRRVRKERSHGC